MEHLQLLTRELQYIEENLQGSLKTEDVAAYCYCSKSSIEKLFKNVNNISVHDYVVRRKMVIAAGKLQKEDVNILHLALSLGYQSHEAFTRAFRQVWHCNPSEYAKQYRFTELYPRFAAVPMEGAISMKKNVDISELYDLLQERKNCYFVCCDICHLIPINEISRKAGDLAILEAMKRISEAAGEEDVMFRIGGDEFVLLTNSGDKAYAQETAAAILRRNGETVSFEGREIPVSLYAAVTRVEIQPLKYQDLFVSLHAAIDGQKEKAGITGISVNKM